MTSQGSQTDRLRAILGGTACEPTIAVFDPISARIASELDFKIGMFAGSIASMTVLAAPDLILLTLTELVQQVSRIVRCCNIPLLVDGDHGYGNALNVIRTVQELERAGAAGVMIEDTNLPVRYGDRSTKLISIEEGVAKMQAAASARQKGGIVVVARTSVAYGVDEAAHRIRAYSQTGVDAVLPVGLKTENELALIRSSTHLPIVFGGDDLTDRKVLNEFGVRIMIGGHEPFIATLERLYEVMREMRGHPYPASEAISGAALFKKFSHRDEYDALIRTFL